MTRRQRAKSDQIEAAWTFDSCDNVRSGRYRDFITMLAVVLGCTLAACSTALNSAPTGFACERRNGCTVAR